MTDANILLRWLRYERIDGVPDEDRRRQCADALTSLAAECERLRRDAQRYRWLRPRLEMRSLQSVAGSSRPALMLRVGQEYFDSKTRGSKGYTKPHLFELECGILDSAIDSSIDAALRESQGET